MIPTPQEAYELLKEYNEGEFHLKHGRIVGDVMRWFAVDQGFGDEADFWQAVGILHDLDFERYPELWLMVIPITYFLLQYPSL